MAVARLTTLTGLPPGSCLTVTLRTSHSMGSRDWETHMLVVDDLGVLNTHLALSRANRDVVGDKKGGACEDVFIYKSLTTRASRASCLSARETMRRVLPMTAKGVRPSACKACWEGS